VSICKARFTGATKQTGQHTFTTNSSDLQWSIAPWRYPAHINCMQTHCLTTELWLLPFTQRIIHNCILLNVTVPFNMTREHWTVLTQDKAVCNRNFCSNWVTVRFTTWSHQWHTHVWVPVTLLLIYLLNTEYRWARLLFHELVNSIHSYVHLTVRKSHKSSILNKRNKNYTSLSMLVQTVASTYQ